MQVPAVTGTLDVYVAEINRFSILTAEEEFRLAVRLKKYNDMEAAEKLVVSNLRFVVKIAHEYRNYGIKLADLVQEGNIGLMHAVKKFDPYRGYRLISYAVWWIRAYIQNYIIKSWVLSRSERPRPSANSSSSSARPGKNWRASLKSARNSRRLLKPLGSGRRRLRRWTFG